MGRTLWEDESSAAAAAAAGGGGGAGDAARKAVFPSIGANLWMSRAEDAWTTDSAGPQCSLFAFSYKIRILMISG